MGYVYVSIGDSLTQGFQSFAISENFQEFCFPSQIVSYNKNLIEDFSLPYIKNPGFPLNLEDFLRNLEELNGTGTSSESLLEFGADTLKEVFASCPPPRGTVHNLAVYGYTTEDILRTTFKNGITPLFRLILRLQDKAPFLSDFLRLASGLNFTNVKKAHTAARDNKFDKFSSYNFARITYYVLCRKRKYINKSQFDIASDICREAGLKGKECIITYWAGSNDILGALLSGSGSYIKGPKAILCHIEKTLIGLLALGNTTVVFSTIPELSVIPFIDKVSLKPVFPVYEALSAETYNNISEAIKAVNKGIREIYSSLYSPRLRLVEMDKTLESLYQTGFDVIIDGSPLHLTTDFLDIDDKGKLRKGGLFSLDGVHPTSTGYAIVANEFIKAFNDMGLGLSRVDVDKTASMDSLITNPPRLIPEFLIASSKARERANQLNLFGFIRKMLLRQFDLEPFR